MYHNKHSKRVLIVLSAIVLLVSGVSSAGDMGDVMKKIVIAGEDIFEWFPSGAYNAVDNEFCLFYRISGFLDPEQQQTWMSGINGRRVAHNGDGQGEPIANLTEYGTALQAWSKPAYNPYRNEYMVSFILAQEETGWDLFTVIIDAQGNNLSGKIPVSTIDAQAQHPFIVFNPIRKVYFVTWDDSRNVERDVFGIMLDESGTVVTEEFVVCDARGDQIFTDMVLNTKDGSTLITWEDFRHVANWREPGDIYGALVSSTGEMLTQDIPVRNDAGEEDEGDQRQQHQTYNSKANNFFVVWWDERPATQDGGIYARIINAAGEPEGEDFELVDYPHPQIFCSVSYHQKSDRIFAVWDDKRDSNPDSEDEQEQDRKDIYARWFLPTGEPDGPEIPIELQEGEQRNPKINYNPLMNQFLIAWRNYNVDEEGGSDAPIGEGHITEDPGNVEGMLYGMPSFLLGRVIEEDTGTPIEDAFAIIMGKGMLKVTRTGPGGWFNLEEKLQSPGTYGILVFKLGYQMAVQFIDYQNTPLEETVRMRKW
jgi:hypothetical protein